MVFQSRPHIVNINNPLEKLNNSDPSHFNRRTEQGEFLPVRFLTG